MGNDVAGRDTRFKPGVSGNPTGRPKRTPDEVKAMNAIRKLAPAAAKKMKEMLMDPRTPAAVRVKICEIILDRTFGKAPASVNITTPTEKLEESRSYLVSLVEKLKEGNSGSGDK